MPFFSQCFLLQDRSQNGDHDSEICLCIDDTEQLESRMDGQPVSFFQLPCHEGNCLNEL